MTATRLPGTTLELEEAAELLEGYVTRWAEDNWADGPVEELLELVRGAVAYIRAQAALDSRTILTELIGRITAEELRRLLITVAEDEPWLCPACRTENTGRLVCVHCTAPATEDNEHPAAPAIRRLWTALGGTLDPNVAGELDQEPPEAHRLDWWPTEAHRRQAEDFATQVALRGRAVGLTNVEVYIDGRLAIPAPRPS